MYLSIHCYCTLEKSHIVLSTLKKKEEGIGRIAERGGGRREGGRGWGEEEKREEQKEGMVWGGRRERRKRRNKTRKIKGIIHVRNLA